MHICFYTTVLRYYSICAYLFSARSMGSVAFRRVIDKDKRFHFNFFTVDLNEEFTGLYGAVLWRQTGA